MNLFSPNEPGEDVEDGITLREGVKSEPEDKTVGSINLPVSIPSNGQESLAARVSSLERRVSHMERANRSRDASKGPQKRKRDENGDKWSQSDFRKRNFVRHSKCECSSYL